MSRRARERLVPAVTLVVGMGEATSFAAEGLPFRENARFELLGQLGRGATGLVYAAHDRERGVRVALKSLRAPAAEDILRFKAEFRALRDIQHPNLISLGELFEQGGMWFFSMELVSGTDFLTYVREGRGDGVSGSTPILALSSRSGERVLTDGTGRLLDDSIDAFSSGEVRTGTSAREGAGNAVDEGRLRAAFVQVTLGLDALHRAGKVHRDIKPSNVLVEPSGRVVILDFGVATELGAVALEEEGEIVGTVSYMAPEQACGEAVGPAADWYAVGVMLYECLTGRTPFSGPANLVLSRKVIEDPPAPTVVEPAASPALSALCMRLLSRAPEVRPTPESLLEGLGVADPASLLAQSREAGAGVFVGRERELAIVRGAFEAVRTEGKCVVFEGPSGIGKSATAQHALDRLRAIQPDVLVLRGRCHESETVPYNAFDGVIDDLSRWLRLASLPAGSLPKVDALLQGFPVLRSVPLLAEAKHEGNGGDLPPVELRRRAFEELRALVASLARVRPIVMLLEDVHWADAESLLLAASWIEPPAPAVLVLATARPSANETSCAFVTAMTPHAHVLRLGGLPPEDAAALARELASKSGDRSELDVDAILGEAKGHPMFLRELVRFARQTSHGPRPRVQLDDALLHRVDRMDPLACKALEVIASAGMPLREGLIAEALKAPRTALATQLSLLRSARLVRAVSGPRGQHLEPYHDRLREAVAGRLDERTRKAIHRRLGLLLEREAAPPELLVSHFERAGALHRAVKHALVAAEQAAETLAFERAAAHYQFVLRSALHGPEEQRALRTRMGEMFQRAGRPRDAAEAYLAAATKGAVPGAERMELMRRVAEQYLMGGYLAEGTDAARAVLAFVGESTPKSRPWLVMVAVARLLWLALVRVAWESRTPEQVSPADAVRIDLYWSLAAGFSFLDSARSVTFQVRGLRWALRHGDDVRIARALSAASFNSSARGKEREALRFCDGAQRAAERSKSDVARLYAALAEVAYLFSVKNDCRKTLEVCATAHDLWRRVGQRGGWESDVNDQFELWSLVALGRLSDVAEKVTDGIRIARATGNRFREMMLRASFPQRHLLADAPEQAEADVVAATREWTTGGFTIPDYLTVKSRCHLAFYAGRVHELGAELETEWRRFDRSILRRMALLTTESTEIRCNLALRRAIVARQRGDGSLERDQLRRARVLLERLRKSPLRFGRAAYVRLHASYLLFERGITEAKPALVTAIAVMEDEAFGAYAAGLRHSLGVALGGDEGGVHLARARAWAEGCGAKSPDRLLRLPIPTAELEGPPSRGR